jgi:hypothetical protein
MPSEVDAQMLPGSDFMVPMMKEDDDDKENEKEEVDEVAVDEKEEVGTELGKEDETTW